MNLSEMSTFVREQADTDDQDAPTSTLTVYARAAYEDIQSRVWPWPSKRVSYTFSTVAGQQFYSWAALSSPDMEFVSSVTGPTDTIPYVGMERYRELDVNLSGSATEASVFTTDPSGLYLWPAPTGVATYTVTGYRQFADWPSGSDEPDLPRGFDEPICWYMLSKYYMFQEDLELANMYMGEFERGVNAQIAKAMRTSSLTAGPRIFGGDTRLTNRDSYSDWVKRSVEG